MDERDLNIELSAPRRVIVGGASIICLDIEQTARLMIELAVRPARPSGPFYFSSVNGQVLVRRHFDRAFAHRLDTADFLSADGQPLVFASRLFSGSGLSQRVATTDLYDVVAGLAEARGASFYLLGGQEAINRVAFEATQKAFPKLRICGRCNGYLSEEELERKIEEINAAAPDILWVALGVPLEHEFVSRFRTKLTNVKVIKTSGGLFDFVAAAKRRAPVWMQAYGLEWAYRLYLEPRRLFFRYALTNPIALILLLTKSRTTAKKTTVHKIALVQTQAENAGAQEVARQLALGLERRGLETFQIFFFRRTRTFDETKNVFFCAVERPSTTKEILRLLRQFYCILKVEKPDAVIAFQHYGNLIAAPLARLAGVRLIVANQVSTPQHIAKPVKLADLIIGLLGAYDKIVVNSADTERSYSRYPALYRRRISRIEHGFHDKSVALESNVARSMLGLPADVWLMGCAARLHPLKQLDLAIRTLAINIETHFAIAGQGPHYTSLKALAKELEVSDRLYFLGELGTAGMGRFLASLDCFVFPSGSESFGLAPVEAAQAGLPVVANDLPVLRDVLSVDGKACAVFIDARNTHAFAAAISKVLEDKTFARELVATGKNLKKRFPLEKMIDEYCAILQAR